MGTFTAQAVYITATNMRECGTTDKAINDWLCYIVRKGTISQKAADAVRTLLDIEMDNDRAEDGQRIHLLLPCQFCPDGHENPAKRPWSVWVAEWKDSDGQPTHLLVCKAGLQHVSESDAEWLRGVLRSAR